MNKTKLSIFVSLQSFLIHASSFGIDYRRRSADFTRHHKFTFVVTALTLLQQLKGSLALELDSVFKQINSPPGSKSGFCKARKKLLPLFFPWLEPISSSMFLWWRVDQTPFVEGLPGSWSRWFNASSSRFKRTVRWFWCSNNPSREGCNGPYSLLLRCTQWSCSLYQTRPLSSGRS